MFLTYIKHMKIITKALLLSGLIATLFFVVISAYRFINMDPDHRVDLFRRYLTKYFYAFSSSITNDKRDDLLSSIKHASQQPWVKEQIASDLEPFKSGISSDQIDGWYKALQHKRNKLVKFTIYNQTVAVQTEEFVKDLTQYKSMYSIISMLAKMKLLPNCTFILALDDYLYYTHDLKNPAAILTFAKHTKIAVEKDTILVPDWQNLTYGSILNKRITFANLFYPWKYKRNVIHWRGGSADSMLHRSKLLSLIENFSFIDAGVVKTAAKYQDQGMEQIIQYVSFVEPEHSLKYKYLISLDGARCSWLRLVWQMHSNSIVIKPESPQVQWFYRGLRPFENYIPIPDVAPSDVQDLYIWLQQNDIAAKDISKNARMFANENLDRVNMLAYYVLLLDEYAKLLR